MKPFMVEKYSTGRSYINPRLHTPKKINMSPRTGTIFKRKSYFPTRHFSWDMLHDLCLAWSEEEEFFTDHVQNGPCGQDRADDFILRTACMALGIPCDDDFGVNERCQTGRRPSAGNYRLLCLVVASWGLAGLGQKMANNWRMFFYLQGQTGSAFQHPPDLMLGTPSVSCRDAFQQRAQRFFGWMVQWLTVGRWYVP